MRIDLFIEGRWMGWIERFRRWLRGDPAKSTAPAYSRTAKDDDEEEEIAELIAIDII